MNSAGINAFKYFPTYSRGYLHLYRKSCKTRTVELDAHAPWAPCTPQSLAGTVECTAEITFLLCTLHLVSLAPHPYPGESSSTPPRGLTGQGDNNQHRSLRRWSTTRCNFCAILQPRNYFKMLVSESFKTWHVSRLSRS